MSTETTTPFPDQVPEEYSRRDLAAQAESALLLLVLAFEVAEGSTYAEKPIDVAQLSDSIERAASRLGTSVAYLTLAATACRSSGDSTTGDSTLGGWVQRIMAWAETNPPAAGGER